MQPTSPVHIGDYTFGDREFAAIARITRDRAGISLKESKRTMVYARLSKRLRKQGFPSFSDYLTFLESPGNDDEIDALIAVLTTNVTSFFREPHHFEAFAAQVLPVAIERAKKGDRVRFWSSACSTGEEPYSLALTILANFPEAGKFDLKILASDVNERVVGIGARATYATEVSRQIPDSYHALLGPDCLRGDTFCMPEKVRDLVTFRRLNLFDPWPFAGQFDAIFCRNVAIYFDKPTQETLWSNLAERLTPRGHLFIGHSERISGPAQNILSQCGVTQYARSATKPITASGGSARPERKPTCH